MLKVIYYPSKQFDEATLAQALDKAKAYLSTTPVGKKTIEVVEGAKEQIHLHVTTERDSTFQHPPGSTAFDAYWNPDIRLQLTSGQVQSPAVALIHELGHARQCIEKLAWYEARSDGSRYLEIEDDNVATHEKPVAAALGEPTRDQYQAFRGTQPFVGRKYANLTLVDKVILFG